MHSWFSIFLEIIRGSFVHIALVVEVMHGVAYTQHPHSLSQSREGLQEITPTSTFFLMSCCHSHVIMSLMRTLNPSHLYITNCTHTMILQPTGYHAFGVVQEAHLQISTIFDDFSVARSGKDSSFVLYIWIIVYLISFPSPDHYKVQSPKYKEELLPLPCHYFTLIKSLMRTSNPSHLCIRLSFGCCPPVELRSSVITSQHSGAKITGSFSKETRSMQMGRQHMERGVS